MTSARHAPESSTRPSAVQGEKFVICGNRRVTAMDLMNAYVGAIRRCAGVRVVPSGRKRFYGVGAEAKRLGVSQNHLWMVLTGRRESRRIMREVRIRVEEKR